jgi:ribonuclease HI
MIGSGALVRRGLLPVWQRRPLTPQDLSHTQILPPHLQLLLDEAVEKELKGKVIQLISKHQARWLSPIFFIPKPDGTFRKIVDSSALNAFLLFPSFKMEDHRMLARMLRRRMFGAKLDVKDAYYHIRVDLFFSFFLCFRNRNKYYRYLGMPFGVSSAPQTFSAIMHQCIAAVRRMWSVNILFYLDDIVVLHHDPHYLSTAMAQIVRFLVWLGWIINEAKSDLTPRQVFVWLGWEWDSVEMTVKITAERARDLFSLVAQLAEAARFEEVWPVRRLASVIGKLNATRFQFRQASLHLVRMHRLKAEAVRRSSWNGSVRLGPEILVETSWWLQELRQNCPAPLQQPIPDATIYTDASPSGWGARVFLHLPPPAQQQQLYLQGLWGQFTQTSNFLELDAVRQALVLLHKQPHIPPLHSVVIRSDSTATCFNINRQAAGPNLRFPLLRLLQFARQHNIYLLARHVPGVANDAADRLSRFSASGDYAINRQMLQSALARLGVAIGADLFATHNNAQHPVFCTMSTDPRSVAQDAFSVRWNDFSFPLIHPPIPLIPRVLQRLRQEKMIAVMIVPLWEAQAWSLSLREITLSSLDLGPMDLALVRGTRMRRNHERLPPGNLLIAIVDTRTTAVASSSSPSSLASASPTRR